MKNLLWIVLTLFLAAGVPGAWAKNSASGKSFGSSSFKSIRQLDTGPSTLSPGSASTSLSGVRPSSVTVYQTWTPHYIFWVPFPGTGPMPEGGGTGWILILVIGAVIVVLLLRRRVPAAGDPEGEEQEQLEVLYERCKKNLDTLASTYIDAQTWLERLEGKVPPAQWRDWNDKFGRVSIEDFTRQLKEIRGDLDQGRQVAARAKLYSFDDDAVGVFEFFREMENTLEDVG